MARAARISGRSTIDALPEIVEAVKGAMPILVDSGFRRGSDIVKALCMGATAVCVGRPYIWGLGAFGQPGVERVLELLRIELSRHDAADGRAHDQAPRPGDGAAGLAASTTVLILNMRMRTGSTTSHSGATMRAFAIATAALLLFSSSFNGSARGRTGHRADQRHADRRHRRARRKAASPS